MRRKRSRQRLWIFQSILLLLAAAGIFFIYWSFTSGGSDVTEQPGQSPAVIHDRTPEPAEQPTPAPTEPPQPVFSEAVWMAVGDIMMHSPQLPGSYDQATKKYNFNPFFTEVKPILAEGDWVIANLETPVAGAKYGYSGYPNFNAPSELVEALQGAGFNLLTTANNHSLDKGEGGVLGTLETLKGYGMEHTGTASSQQEADQLLIAERNGIKMGLIAYTYGTNGIPIPTGKDYLVNLIDEQKIIADMKRLREAGADLVTVSLHFGNEYQTQPSEEQKQLARSLVAAGADIIAGSHPHVVQPYEVVETSDENGRIRKALIIYSMGNFISNQRGDSKDYGVIFKVQFRKNMNEGTVELTEVESIPTWVHRYKPDKAFRYRVLPLEQTLAAAADPLLTKTEFATLRKDYEMLRKRLDSMK
ncbi:CapA family protein [Paenibacillus harenae]|uniref:CapA family protein n=1 Tax=Paenibacillus harenae TaxID=306543 RepID=UPI00278FBB3A|nr:CapA family protein [Paenibacillus harenae]MDQ0058102.1 poly-gamma-glutamate synthesis protein (capsule biosynthesis protein) [Paenibacillus harenae]